MWQTAKDPIHLEYRALSPVLTLKETLASQENLAELCDDRPLETRELLTTNAYYGVDAIIKEYAGLPRKYQLKAVIPHGIELSRNFLAEYESKALLPVVLSHPAYRDRLYSTLTDKIVIPSAATFLYVLQLVSDQPQPNRQGTIFFPQHSTQNITVQADFENLADQLSYLPDEYKPITICIYWKDFILGHHIPFQKRGMRIVSAGHIFDHRFLFRLYHLCSIHRYSAGNSFGTHLFYSVTAGCSYFHIPSKHYSYLAEKEVLMRNFAPLSPATEATLGQLFGTPTSAVTEYQAKVVDSYLRVARLQTPAQLRWQLFYAELLDKFGLMRTRNRNQLNLVAPTYLRRLVVAGKYRLARQLGSAVKGAHSA